jgi:hypothetical protein
MDYCNAGTYPASPPPIGADDVAHLDDPPLPAISAKTGGLWVKVTRRPSTFTERAVFGGFWGLGVSGSIPPPIGVVYERLRVDPVGLKF